MPALDRCHPIVERALQKEGWRVSSPGRFSTEERDIYIDILASRQQNGAAQQLLLVEVKCFLEGLNLTQELYTALGQYLVYRAMLKLLQNNTPLYLAIPRTIFEQLDAAIMDAIADNKIKVIVVDFEVEAITRWIE
jgi:hypothetical protein